MRHVITPEQARALGMPRSRFRRLRPIFYGVRALPEVPVTLPVLVEAARTFLPPDAVATGFTALRLHGAPVGTDLPLRFVTREHVRLRRSGVEARQVDHLPEHIGRVAIVGAAFAAACTQAPLLEAVTTGDRLIHGGFLHPRDARAIEPHCRAGAESPQETKLRLTLVLAGLPEPDLQVVLEHDGRFLGRVDAGYRCYRVIIEYEGDQHRERGQWDCDIARYEELSRLGWIVIRVTAARLRNPARLVDEVDAALRSRGYRGPEPRLDAAWQAQVA